MPELPGGVSTPIVLDSTELSPGTLKKVALKICENADDAREAKEFLDMLGVSLEKLRNGNSE